MNRVALALPIVLFLATCTAYRAQHGIGDGAVPAAASKAGETNVPVSQEPLPQRHILLISEIDKYQAELAENGKYECCVTPACRQCALTAGECHCRHVIAADGPCCGECTQAWVEGRGNIPGVDREKVLEHLGCVRELYEKQTPEGMVPPGQRREPPKSDGQ